MDKCSYALPHELGHASNFKSKGLGMITSKSFMAFTRINMFLIPLLFFGVLNNSAEDSSEKSGFLNKCLGFIKRNAIGIAAISQIPILAEEGLASVKSINMMKNYISPKELGMLKRNYGYAFLTYAVNAATLVASIFAAKKVKNIVAEKNSQKVSFEA